VLAIPTSPRYLGAKTTCLHIEYLCLDILVELGLLELVGVLF